MIGVQPLIFRVEMADSAPTHGNMMGISWDIWVKPGEWYDVLWIMFVHRWENLE